MISFMTDLLLSICLSQNVLKDFQLPAVLIDTLIATAEILLFDAFVVIMC